MNLDKFRLWPKKKTQPEGAVISHELSYERMERTDGSIPHAKPTLSRGEGLGGGHEGTIIRTPLEQGRLKSQGLALKLLKFYGEEQRDVQENTVRHILKIWQHIRELNRKLKSEGKQLLNTPSTIRGVFTDKQVGVLMTDLSSEGKYEVLDLRKPIRYHDKISREQWKEVKEKVLYDAVITAENGISLMERASADDDHTLDPWAIVQDKDDKSVKTFLLDIGQYSETELSSEQEQALTEFPQVVAAVLERVEAELETFWVRSGR